MQKIILPKSVKTAISALNNAGFRADIVGGCVRDFLLNKTPYDYDVTTNATPEEMKAVFFGFKTVETGIKHGTLTVIIDSMPIEITTYRRDGEYKDHRHPENVEFTKELASDLSRRDFTMNAICYNDTDGITDLYCGAEDISRGIIRSVGDASRRFDEDALRIMRAVRFAATLGFDIEENTEIAARDKMELLAFISGERIYVEWQKLLLGEHAYPVLEKYSDIISVALGVRGYKLPDCSLFSGADFYTRFFSLFITAEDGKRDFIRCCDRLRTDNKVRSYGTAVLSSASRPLSSAADIKRAMSELGEKEVELLIRCRILVGIATESELTEYERILSSGEAYRVSHLAVCGRDIMALGISGVAVGKTLASVLDAVIRGNVQNEKEDIIKYLKSYTDSI